MTVFRTVSFLLHVAFQVAWAGWREELDNVLGAHGVCDVDESSGLRLHELSVDEERHRATVLRRRKKVNVG